MRGEAAHDEQVQLPRDDESRLFLWELLSLKGKKYGSEFGIVKREVYHFSPYLLEA